MAGIGPDELTLKAAGALDGEPSEPGLTFQHAIINVIKAGLQRLRDEITLLKKQPERGKKVNGTAVHLAVERPPR